MSAPRARCQQRRLLVLVQPPACVGRWLGRNRTVVLYAIAAGGNASHGADDSTIKVILVVIAALQSLIFFLLKAHELSNPSGVAVLRS